MNVIDKSRMLPDPNTTHPQFGEEIEKGALRACFVGLYHKRPHQYMVQVINPQRNEIWPAGVVKRTHKINDEFLEVNIGRVRGGPKTGARREGASDPVGEKLEEQKKALRKVKQAPKGEIQPKSKHKKQVEEVVRKVACLGCGKTMLPDMESVEPYRCGKCKNVGENGLPIFHSPIFKV